MWLLTFILLVLLGLLGIAGWLKAQRPDAARHLEPLEQFEGWIGAAGLVWGLLLLLRWLSALRVAYLAGGAALVLLLTTLVVLAISLVLSIVLLRSMFGDGDFMQRLTRLAERIAPYRIGLGFACLLLALYTLFLHAF